LPVSFFWTPKGFAAEYRLQVSTNADFSTLVADVSGLMESRYANMSVATGTRYYWRVNTSNDGGVGDWATNSFTTVPPMVQVSVPNGGEAWQRTQSYFIQWNANIPGNVALDLYKAGAFFRTITTNAANVRAYRWTVTSAFTPGSDYSIAIRSTTNSALSDMSDATFSIVDAPVISSSSATRLPNGQVQFGYTAPGAAQATVWGTTILSPPIWQNLGPMTVTGGSRAFTNTPPYLFYRVSVP
jgi:hypothetical protein